MQHGELQVTYYIAENGLISATIEVRLPTDDAGQLHPAFQSPERFLVWQELLPDWGEREGAWRVKRWQHADEDWDTVVNRAQRKLGHWLDTLRHVASLPARKDE